MTTKKIKQGNKENNRKDIKELRVPIMRLQNDTSLDSKITFYDNINEEIIAVTRDKLVLQLEKYQQILESQKGWQSPLSSVFTSGVALASVDKFRGIPFFPAPVCEAAIKIVFLGSFAWLIVSLVQLYKNRDKGDINSLIENLKGQKTNSSPSVVSQERLNLIERVRFVIRGGDK